MEVSGYTVRAGNTRPVHVGVCVGVHASRPTVNWVSIRHGMRYDPAPVATYIHIVLYTVSIIIGYVSLIIFILFILTVFMLTRLVTVWVQTLI
jgi:hypothetical protein